jgi:hypothetical protein
MKHKGATTMTTTKAHTIDPDRIEVSMIDGEGVWHLDINPAALGVEGGRLALHQSKDGREPWTEWLVWNEVAQDWDGWPVPYKTVVHLIPYPLYSLTLTEEHVKPDSKEER